jgi:hypothetical protein
MRGYGVEKQGSDFIHACQCIPNAASILAIEATLASPRKAISPNTNTTMKPGNSLGNSIIVLWDTVT